jgi:uroporphyrinogen-III synthase
MKDLTGKRIAIAADRQSEAIRTMVEKKGGEAVVYSIQGKQHLDEQTSRENVKTFLAEEFEWAVLTTGIGARTLAESASKAGLAEAFISKLKKTKLVIRGSKTMKWLKENDLQPYLLSEDGTMNNLLEAFAEESASESRIFLQAYNQDDARLKEELEHNGGNVYLSQPYIHEAPPKETVTRLQEAISARSVDAVLFTSKKQVINLFSEENSTLIPAFDGEVLAAAVGKVTAGELENRGITEVLQPESQKMGAMIVEIERYYRKQKSR